MPVPTHGEASTAVNLHRIGVVSDSDPGAIGAWKIWTEVDGSDNWVATHERDADDAGWHTLASAAGATPAAHATSHENGGSDEISVAGLSGLLDDTQDTTIVQITDATAAGKALLDDADAAAQRTTLGLGTAAVADLDTDATLAANSNTRTPSQAAIKSYVASQVNGLAWKHPVRVATTVAGTLASSFENGDTIDGVTLATGDAILIKDQADPTENGIYFVNASGAPTRRSDADTGAELENATVMVREGTANHDTQWTCTTDGTITIGSSNLTWAQVSGGSSQSADETTLHLAGSTYSIKAGGVGTTELANSGVTEGKLGLSDVTTANVSITKHGFAPKAPNDASLFLDGTGNYSTPEGTVAPTTPSGSPDIWFMADDPSLTVNGSNEPTSIPNNGAFGGTFTLDATSSKRGTLVASLQNGLAGLRMDGTDDYLRMNFTAQTGTSWTIFIVCRRQGAGSSQRRLCAMAKVGTNNDFGSSTTFALYFDNGTNTTGNYHRNGTTAVSEIIRNVPTIVEIASDGTYGYFGYNGLIGSSLSSVTSAVAALDVTDLVVAGGIGGSGGSSPDTNHQVDLFEVLAYFGASALTAAQRSSTRSYLSKRWAIPVLQGAV